MKTSTLLLATLGLTFASLSAQTVPEFLNYQGTVTDSTGVGLGDTAPVNRKVLFRIYNAATVGALVWTEEQTVTISKGEFSVLLGQGIPFGSEPHGSLLTVFGEGATDRYVAITVDNGDGTLNASDLPIAPRQRITSTAYSFRAGTADSIASGSSLKLNSADSGLGYFDSSRLFGGISVNGPVLYGAGGGALGVDNGAGTQTAALRWDSGGDVGIGVTAPLAGQKLHVAGSSYFEGSVKIVSPTATAFTIQSPTAGGYGLKHTNGATSLETWVSTGQANLQSTGSLNILAASTLSLFTNNSPRLTVNSSGNVGIGTANPGASLEIGGANSRTNAFRITGTQPGIYFNNTSGKYWNQWVSGNGEPASSGALVFYNGPSGGYRMVIEPDGDVGIGTTSPTQKLTVSGGYADISGLRLGGQDSANTIYHPTGDIAINTHSSTEKVTIGSNLSGTVMTVTGSSVGIGMSPSYLFDVNGTLRATTIRNNGDYLTDGGSTSGIKWMSGGATSNTLQAHIFRWGSSSGDGRLLFTNSGNSNTTGVYLAVGGTSLTSTSDERLKSEIEPITGILDKISDIRVVGFNMASTSVDPETGKMKVDSTPHQRTTKNGKLIKQEIGSIAQDWIESFPELVMEPHNDEGFYGLNYDRIGVVALGAAKELNVLVVKQQAEIADLTARVARLEAKDAARDARLAAIEQLLSAK